MEGRKPSTKHVSAVLELPPLTSLQRVATGPPQQRSNVSDSKNVSCWLASLWTTLVGPTLRIASGTGLDGIASIAICQT
jgi:hypothetical protein